MSDVDVAQLICRLIAINSANPATCSHGAGEARIAEFCSDWLNARGVRARLEPLSGHPERPAVIARFEGERVGPHVVLLGHLDTYTWYEPDEFDLRRRIRGPGAFDMKGGVAAILCAMSSIASTISRGAVTALLVPDEEHLSFGVRTLAPTIEADAAIVTEGTSTDIGTRHDGRMRAYVQMKSLRERDITVLTLAAMARCRQPALRGISIAYAGEPSPRLILQRVITPGENASQISEDLACLLRPLGIEQLEWDIREPFLVDENGFLCRCIRKHALRYALSAQWTGVHGWTEAGVLAAAGIPCVVFGPHGGGAHTCDEWVDADSVESVANALADAVVELCSLAPE